MPDRPIRLLALVGKEPDISPGQRFRLEQWAPHLATRHGIELTFAPFESPALTDVLYRPGHGVRKTLLVLRDAWRRWESRRASEQFDAVVVYREAMLLGGAWMESWLHRRGVPLIYDFDDAIWMWSPSARNGLMSLARAPWKTATICRLASAVTAGNAFLADWARSKCSDVTVVRTSIDIDQYPAMPPPSTAGRPFTIVWTGSHSTLAHLELARGALEALGRERPLRLRVICDTPPPPFAHLELEFVPWRAASEAHDLAPADVGIMPLPDTPSARGKCGCKALQYMAIGRPAVVSPVGVNTEIIRDNVNGLLARTSDEWMQALRRLAADANLRQRLGAAGRSTVLAGFTAASSADAFAAVVRRVVPTDASRAPLSSRDP